MDSDFWHNTWAERKLGFNQAAPNSLLTKHWPSLGIAEDALVFAPLAGKSIDLWWLRERGHGVLAVELSPVAVQEFFDEAKVTPARSREGAFDVLEANGVRFLVGDFFALSAEQLAKTGAVYDRASLVALPPDMRRAYAKAMTEKLPASTTTLLVSMETESPTTDGPPFSVVEREVRELFSPAFDVTLLERSGFTEVPSRGGPARANVAYAMRR